MAIEIVDFPIKNGDFPWQNVSSPEGNGFTTYKPSYNYTYGHEYHLFNWLYFSGMKYIL